MLQEADDDVPVGAGGASSVVVAANQLKKSGAFDQMRAVLEKADRTADEGAAMLYIGTLDRLDDHPAMQAEVTDMVQRLRSGKPPSAIYLAFLLRQAERACLPLSLIAEALEFCKTRPRKDGGLDLAFGAVKRRQNFRVNQAELARRATIVSLGLHCLPWTLLNRWGMRTPAQYVDEFNPFCLAIHLIPGVIAALQTDFATYMAPDEFKVVKSALGHPVALRHDRTAIWNHNQGAFWMQDECAVLRASMDAKIANFRRSCQAENPVFVIGNCLDDYPGVELKFLPDLKKALRQATGRKNSHVIITNQRASPPEQNVFHVDKYTSFFYCPYPDKSYIWFDANSVDSPVGLTYERAYLKSLFACLRRWKLVDTANEDA